MKTSDGSGNRKSIIVLLALQLAGGFVLSPQRTFFPVFAEEAGVSVILIAAISSARQVAGMLAALIGGILADRIGRKWTYFIGNAGFLLGGMLFATNATVAVTTLWIASGFLLGIRTLGGQSYLIDVARSKSIGILSALFTWGTTLGGAGGSLLLGLLLARSGYALFGVVVSVLSIVVLGVNGTLMPGAGRDPRAVHDVNGRSGPGRAQLPDGDSRLEPTRYRDLIGKPPVMIIAALRFLPTFYWGMAIVLVPLLIKELGGGTIVIALYGTVSQVAASAAQLITGRIADRRGFPGPARVVLSILAVSIAATAVWSGNLPAVFAASTIGASAAWSMSSLIPVLVSHTVPPAARAKTLGWIHFWWNMGMVAGAAVGGALYEVDHSLPFVVAAAVNVVPIVLLGFLGRSDTNESG